MRTRGPVGPEPLVTLLADGAAVPDHTVGPPGTARRHALLLASGPAFTGKQGANPVEGESTGQVSDRRALVLVAWQL
jgi:hypothetical protein